MSGTEYDLTANFQLKKPWIDADDDIWGIHLNQNMDLLDNLLQTRGFAQAYLPIAGGIMDGMLTLVSDPIGRLDASTKQYTDGAIAQAGNAFLPLIGGEIGGDLHVDGHLTGNVNGATTLATGTVSTRALADRFADVVNVRDFGAVFDGASHPLSAYFPTLGAAQIVYPHAVALTDEIDGVAIQAAINLCQSRVVNFAIGGTVQLPCGIGLINQPLTISKQQVSLVSQGSEFMLNSVIQRFNPSSATRLTWTGAARSAGQFQVNMLTVAPTDGNRLLSGNNVTGILFFINSVAGTAGPLIASVRHARIECATFEPAGIPYPGASVTAGSQTITVSSTAGLRLGESVVSASLTAGAYVASIIDATHFNVSSQATATSTETITVGGEGIRFDVVDGLNDSNSTQGLRVRFAGYAIAGAANATGPLISIGGSGVLGAQGGTSWGNTSLNWFEELYPIYNNGHGVVMNNSDHNFHSVLFGQKIGAGAGRLLICNGSLDAHNGAARYHTIDQAGDGGLQAGTDTGGFTAAAIGNQILNLHRANGGALPTIGAGAWARIGADNQIALAFSGGAQAFVAQYPDSAVSGGNARGSNASDLQTLRASVTQVASGANAVLTGGFNNTVSGQNAVIGGGSGNIVSALYGVIPGGTSNSVSQSYSVAAGNSAAAELYGMMAYSNGVIAAGRKSQYNLQILRGVSAANTTPVRLTSDAAAASGINTVNQIAASQVSALTVMLTATDSTNAANCFVWRQPLGLLKRVGAVTSVTYAALGTPVSGGAGTTAGIAITEAADTTNGGYSLTFTPPTGNAVVWRVVATVEWTRVDGA